MNKAELVTKVAKEAGISQTAAGKAVDSAIDGIARALRKGNSVRLVGFGTFSVTHRKARVGRNPHTGDALKIKARKVVKFKPGKALKEKVR